MRFFSILTALVVTVTLYMVVVERDRLIAFAQGGADPSAEDVAAGDEGASAELPGAVSVVAFRSEAVEIDRAVLLRGRTEAARQVDVRAETSGTVVSDPLRKGALVEAGDVLCRIDPGTREVSRAEALALLNEAKSRVPTAEAALAEARTRAPEAEARVAEAEARLDEANINYNAALKLSEGGFASETRVASTRAAVESAQAGVQSARSQLEAARAGVESAKSQVEAAKSAIQSAEAGVAAAETEIERLTITAPFSGLLETDAAELGSLLQPGSLCATVIQLDPIKLVGFVPETQVDRVTLGAQAGARLATGREVMGEVSFLSRSADETTRTFRIEATVPNPDLTISDGQTAEIQIRSDGQPAHLLPQSALTLDDAGRLGVRLVDVDSLAAFAEVSVVRDASEGIYVVGLPDAADVIVVGQEFVTDGVPVRPTYREGRK